MVLYQHGHRNLLITRTESIWNDAALLALGVIGPYYETNLGHVIGIFEPNATWGQSGAAWGSLIDYWNYTRDAEYSSPVQQALLAQMGPNNDYMPPNQTKTEVGLYRETTD